MQERVHIVVETFFLHAYMPCLRREDDNGGIPATNQRRMMMSDERNEAEQIHWIHRGPRDMISVQEGSTVSRTVMQKA